jgi:glycosyltransferase involved in cell wall biosynthesis
VSPSYHEGFGLPFVEAMAAGCPVIGSDRGSLSEVVGNAGILVDPEDVSAIANAMEQMANDKKLRDEFVQKGLAKSRNYSWDKTAQEIYKLITSFSHT